MSDSYCSTEDVAVGLGIPSAGNEDRLGLAALLGSAYVDLFVSGTVSDAELTPPYAVTAVACPPSYRAAAIVAAVRFYSSKDVPFGVVSVGEYGRVLGAIPEADLLLRGHKTSFGIG